MQLFDTKMTKDQCRDTGMAMVLLCLLAERWTRNEAWLIAAVVLQIVNMTVPRVFYPLAIVWFGLSHLMGTVMSKVLLSVVFVVILTPIGLLRRMMGKDSLKLRAFRASKESSMLRRDHLFTASDMESPY